MGSKAHRLQNPDMKDFYKHMENIGGRVDLPQVFRDFLEMGVCSFALGSMEKEYFETIKPYNQKELAEFPKMMACVFNFFNKVETWADPFGEIYEEITGNFKRSAFGQFFTPASVCDLSAQILYSDELPKGATILDPCSGSGRMILAAHAKNKNSSFRYYATDKDRICVNMTALNMVFHGIQGFVVWGDTLSLDVYGGYEINYGLSAFKVPHLRKLKKSASKPIIENIKKTIEDVEKPPENEQYLLKF